MPLVECVPNFSEGRRQEVIQKIIEAIASVEGITVLDVDPGKGANRTVVTFVGPPEAVEEAAYQGIYQASLLIDMAKHQGEHPRMGATDVCPFVPIAGVTMEDCIQMAHRVAKRVGETLHIPVYLYEEAATKPERRNLADIRKGEYEALPEKLKDPRWKPDYGPSEFNPKSGATVIGARPFLIAYNINLNTRDRKKAHGIALTIREKGRAKRDENGKIIRDEKGNIIYAGGLFKACKAVGWYIEDYQRAQISINLTNFHITPPHLVFDKVCELAEEKGLRVTGSEIVGMVPLEALLMAGRHYLKKQGKSAGVSDEELVHTAIMSLGLNDVAPFDAEEKIIEWKLKLHKGPLVSQPVYDFVQTLASDAPAPGGGSTAALGGALAGGLGSMVAQLTHAHKDYQAFQEEMDTIAETCQKLKKELLLLVDKDTEAFNKVIQAMRMPKKTPEQKEKREGAIQKAYQEATRVPGQVLQGCFNLVEPLKTLQAKGMESALSDIGTAFAFLQASAWGALFNQLINLPSLQDEAWKEKTRQEALKTHEAILKETEKLLRAILEKLKAP